MDDLKEWQPISTAPECRPILVWVPRENSGLDSAEVVIRVNDSWWTNGGPNGGVDMWFEHAPTHWMPLPAPPINAHLAQGETGDE